MGPRGNRWDALLVCLFSALTVLVCAGLFLAAVLVPAPPAVLPLVAIVCIGAPMLASWELRGALAALTRSDRGNQSDPPVDSRALAALRRHLEQLPETRHPLGL